MSKDEKLLTARDFAVNLEVNLNKRVVSNSVDAGFVCSQCDLVFKDSLNYLDHINGRLHLSKIGFSMNVERSTLSQVKARLEDIKRKRDEPQKEFILEDDVLKLKKEEQDEKDRKKVEKRLKKTAKQDKAAEEKAEFHDSSIEKMMGFGSFGK